MNAGVDPAKVWSKLSDLDERIAAEETIAQAMREHVDEHEREAWRLKVQRANVAALLDGADT